jgi:hypothetical protein
MEKDEKVSSLDVANETEMTPKLAGQLITSMLGVFIRGKEAGKAEPRVARLIEELYGLAIRAESESVRLAAITEIMNRIDGKVIEKKEIKSVRIEGIVYIPESAGHELLEAPLLPGAAPAEAAEYKITGVDL